MSMNPVKRDHFVTSADIQRIEVSQSQSDYKVSNPRFPYQKGIEAEKIHLHPDDEPPPGSGLAKNTFALIIQVLYQKEMFEKHGHAFAGIDATHNTTHYLLITITLACSLCWCRISGGKVSNSYIFLSKKK